MSFACFGGAIDYDGYGRDLYKDESTAVAFTKNGVGSYLANTRYGLAFKKTATVNMEFYDKLKQGLSLGESLQQTKKEMLPYANNDCDFAVIYQVQLYGDPTLKLK